MSDITITANGWTPPDGAAPKCQACGRKAAPEHYCKPHDVVLCASCAWTRHERCSVWERAWHGEGDGMSAEEQMREGAKRLARESSNRWARARADDARRELLRRCIQVAWLAVVAGLVAFAIALSGCSSSVPDIVRDRAPAARRAAELYVERTIHDPAYDDGDPGTTEDEEREETRALGRSLVRYLREMETATR